MRSTAALASALEEAAQVRYSRSGNAPGPRRPNHDLEPTDSIDNAWATFSTASKECSAPLAATRTSKMPGLIGATMFSPRPARGYRFHSLQVEIIFVLPQLPTSLSFSSNHRARKRHLSRNPNTL